MKKIITLMSLSYMFATSLVAFEHLHTIDEFKTKTKKGNYIVDFYAPWCHPCKEMEKNLNKINLKKENIKVFKINIEESQELLAAYGTPQIPALLYIKDGEILKGYVGLKGMPELHSDIENYFKR
jgi:thiol-disulfide isomerase/thioredoxin